MVQGWFGVSLAGGYCGVDWVGPRVYVKGRFKVGSK